MGIEAAILAAPAHRTAAGRRNGEPLPKRFATRELSQRLARRGYATAAFVTARLLANGMVGLRGFEIYDAPTSILRPGRDAVADALAWLAVEATTAPCPPSWWSPYNES